MKALLLIAALAAPVTVTLPDNEPMFTGPDADLLNANCLACHSAEMVLAQPKMTAEQWGYSVQKMQTVYKAPIEDADAAKLPAALVRLQNSGRGR
jgi:hypothetical protein